MSTRLPTNIVFSCAKQGLTGIKALITPASPELTAIQGAPVGKLFDITFQLLAPTLVNGDLLTNEADPTESYRLRGVEHFATPPLAHTHALAEKGAA